MGHVATALDGEASLHPVEEEAEELDLRLGAIGPHLEPDHDVYRSTRQGQIGRLLDVPAVIENDMLHERPP